MTTSIDIINTKENRALLYKYLRKFFGSKRAKELMRKHKDNLFTPYGLAYSIGKHSFSFYCEFFLQQFFVPKDDNDLRPLAPVHREIWSELENIFIYNTHDKQEFILSRGLGKSVTINMALSCYIHCYKLSTYTVILANRELDATNFVEQTKIALQTPYIVHTFRNLVNPKKRTVNKLQLELDNDTMVAAVSAQTSVRGTAYTTSKGRNRVTCFIADDYISENDVLNEDAKQKKYMRWIKEVEEAGDEPVFRNGKLIKPGCKFIVIGTPLAQGDFIDSIRKNPEYKVFHRGVVDFDVDEYFDNHEGWQEFKRILFDDKLEDSLKSATEYYQQNKSTMEFPTLWEGKYECNKLAMKYFNKRIAFMQELMCDCQNIGDKWFTSNKTQPMKQIEDHTFVKTMMTVDTAGVKNKDTRRSDYFAFTVGSLASNGFKYVRSGQLRKFENDFDAYLNHVIELLKQYTDITHVSIEKNQFGGIDVDRIEQEIQSIPELKSRRIKFINEMARKNKDDRISTIVSDINNGRIIFCEERVEKQALDQLMEFSGQQFTRNDDFVDSVCDFANRIDDIEVLQQIKSIPKDWLF